jgi:hypothetical protein
MSGSIEERLDELQRESERRRQELREIAADLPAALSRKQLLRAIVVDIRRAPKKGNIASRAVTKAARTPGQLYRSITSPRTRSQ